MGKDKQDIYTVLQALQSLAALTDPEYVQTAALALRITQRLPVVTSISYPWSSVHSVELACRAEEFAESGRLRGITPEGVVDILCCQEETAQYLAKIATLPQEKFSRLVVMAYQVYQERSHQKTLSIYYGETLRNFVQQL